MFFFLVFSSRYFCSIREEYDYSIREEFDYECLNNGISAKLYLKLVMLFALNFYQKCIFQQSTSQRNSEKNLTDAHILAEWCSKKMAQKYISWRFDPELLGQGFFSENIQFEIFKKNSYYILGFDVYQCQNSEKCIVHDVKLLKITWKPLIIFIGDLRVFSKQWQPWIRSYCRKILKK